MEKNNEIGISSLAYLAIKYSEKMIDSMEIRQQNITELFWQELNTMIEHNELINIQIMGKVISGKSTIAILLQHYINEKLGITPSLEYICADQWIFARKTLENYKNCCFVVDEWSALEESGLGSSVESKYLEQFSDVQAQRFIHRISSTPNKIMDKNADIILETLGIDKNTKTTRCLAYYKRTKPQGEIIQEIGYIDFNVKEIIQKEYYKKYREKKFKKMELTQKEGIFNLRNIYFSEIILNVYKAYENLVNDIKITKDMILLEIEAEARNQKLPLSIFAKDQLEREIFALLQLKKAVKDYERQAQKEGMTEETKELIRIKRNHAKIRTNLNIERLERIVEIGKQYQNI